MIQVDSSSKIHETLITFKSTTNVSNKKPYTLNISEWSKQTYVDFSNLYEHYK